MSATPSLRSNRPGTAAARLLAFITRRGDLLLAGLVLAVIALMVLPLPLFVLDSLIACNLSFSIALLMLSFYLPSALALSTFPSLLLFTTLLRLALNIASTKQILLNADAGHIIDTFGRLVVGGNVVVGLVVFIIIAVVQFIVIAKGAERVAEVGARFTLDALPGKQMSIDADLRAGLIDKHEARRRRTELERESKLHGAMDGAMKFVKGDAIAALVIAFVNIVAGIAIGMAQNGLPLSEALATYTVLTVGDGMVSQIPSLFVSIAAGVVITRVGSEAGDEASLGPQVMQQVLRHPAALALSAATLAAFMLVPGFPALQFGALALLFGGVAALVHYSRRRERGPGQVAMPAMAREGAAAPALLAQDAPALLVPLALRLAPDLRARLDAAAFNTALQAERDALRQRLGLPFPGLRIAQDEGLSPGHFAVDLQELPGAPEGATEGPAGAAESHLAARVGAVAAAHAEAFIGSQEVQSLLERAALELPDLVAELQRAVPASRMAELLRRLLQEGVSIRPLREICESLLAWGPREKDMVMLTERVRVDLGRFVTRAHLDAQQRLQAVLLDAQADALLRDSVQQGAAGGWIALPPAQVEALQAGAARALAALPPGQPPLLLCSMEVRRYLKKLLEAQWPGLVVLSFQELPPQAQLVTLGVLSLDAAALPLAA